MINSLFILTADGNVLLEKHWRIVVSRTVIEYFLDNVRKASHPEEVLPVIPMQRLLLVHILRNNLIYLAVVSSEVAPLLVIEFLHRVASIFKDYFGEVNEFIVKDNFVTVYQLVEELMDNGFPLTTEPNILKEMIVPPTIVNRVVNTVTSSSNVSSTLPNGSLSMVPWRKAGVKYGSNEIYMDITEEIEAIIEPNGQVASSEVRGDIQCNCRLSGMPDLTVTFVNPSLLDDVSFHPCIRINRYERERVLSFVPPDGVFELMRFRINTGTNFQMPVYVKPQIHFSGGSAKIDVSCGARHTGGRVVEGMRVHIPLPMSTISVNISVNHGSFEFDPVSKMLRWDVGRIPKEKVPMMSGNAMLQPGATVEGNPTLTAEFKINMFSTSGLKISALTVANERYKPYKGVKSITKSGKFQIRS